MTRKEYNAYIKGYSKKLTSAHTLAELGQIIHEKKKNYEDMLFDYNNYQYDVPDYLQESLDKANSGTVEAAKISSATLPATISALIGQKKLHTNLAATGTSGGFQDQSLSEFGTSAGINLQSIISDQKQSMEQERLSIMDQINTLETNWRTSERSTAIRRYELEEQQRQFKEANSGWF